MFCVLTFDGLQYRKLNINPDDWFSRIYLDEVFRYMKEIALSDVIHLNSDFDLKQLFHTSPRNGAETCIMLAHTQKVTFGRGPLNV